MRIAVASAFRNSPEHQVQRWAKQLSMLSIHHTVRAIAAVGDCRPGDHTVDYITDHAMVQRGLRVDIVTCNHGGPIFGSVEDPKRMECLSHVGDAWLNAVRPADDVVVYVESDLIWDVITMNQLIKYADSYEQTGFDIVAPFVFAGPHFYDVWGFRRGGARFAPFHPYHHDLANFKGTIIDVDSVGSCLAMRGSVAMNPALRMLVKKNALVGYCETARELGYSIGAAPGLRIEHPA